MAIAAQSGTAHAQSTWQGNTNSDYNTSTNWDNNTAPTAAGQSARFSGGATTSTVSLSSAVFPDSWTVSAGNYNISGSSVAFQGSGLLNSGGNTSISTNISGVGDVTVTGGTLTLTGTNSYAGTTNIQGGTLVINSTAASSGSAYNVSAGGTLSADASGSTIVLGALTGGGVVNSSNGSVTISIGNNGASSNFSGIITNGTGTVSISKAGPGSQTLSAANTYSGGTNLLGGKIVVVNNNALGTGTLSMENGTTLQSGFAGLTIANSVAIAAAASATIDTNSNSMQLSGVIDGVGSNLTKSSSGTLTLLAQNNATGTLTVNAGTATLASARWNGAVSVTNAGTFSSTGTSTITGAATNNGTMTVTSGALTAGSITNNGTLTINAGATLNDDLDNAGTTTNNGTNNSAVASNTGTINNNSGATWNGNVASNTGTLNNAGTWNGSITNSGTVNASGAIRTVVNQGSGAFTVTGALSAGNNPFTNQGTATLNVTSGDFTGISTLTNSSTAGAGVNIAIGRTLTAQTVINAAGSTILNDGQLNASAMTNNGVITNSYTLANTQTLIGTGSIANLTVTGGTFTPGSGAAGTKMDATNFTFQGGTYVTMVNPATASFTNVTGTATLTGGSVNAQFASGSYLTKSYTILSAGTRTGTFTGGLTTNNLPTGFSASLGYTSTGVTLELVMQAIQAGVPANQQGAANSIANYFNNGGSLPPGFVTLTGLTGTQQQRAYSQVSGEGGNGATQSAAYSATSQFMNTIFDSSIEGRGTDGGVPSFDGDASEALAYVAGRRKSQAEREALAAVTPRHARDGFAATWSVWATGYGGTSSVNGDTTTGTQSTNSRIYGTAVGAEYRLGRDTLVGVSMGGAGASFSTSAGLGSGRAELLQLGLYGRHHIGAVYVAGAIAYGWQDVTTDRTVSVSGTDQLRANFNAHAFAARTEAGYRFTTALVGATPYAAVQATTFYLPGYAETAVSGTNTFALSFASQTSTNVRSELGLRTDKSFVMAEGLLTLRGRAAWAHDSNTDRTINPTFQTLPGSSSFTVSGARPSPDGALFTAGAEMKWRDGWSLAGTFEGEFSRTTESYLGKGSVRYAW